MGGCMGTKSAEPKILPPQDCIYTLAELQAMVPKAEGLGSIQLSVLNNQILIYDDNCGALVSWIKENIEDV